MAKICEKCGDSFDGRGFHWHQKSCDGTKREDRPIDIPSLDIKIQEMKDSGILNDADSLVSSADKEEEIVSFESEKKCICKGFEGEAFHCKKHSFRAKCPKCNCIETSKLERCVSSCNEYKCSMCSYSFKVSVITGEYIDG